MSKTERMRHYLREHGSARGITLAMEADLASVSLVSALLDGDIKKRPRDFQRWPLLLGPSI